MIIIHCTKNNQEQRLLPGLEYAGRPTANTTRKRSNEILRILYPLFGIAAHSKLMRQLLLSVTLKFFCRSVVATFVKSTTLSFRHFLLFRCWLPLTPCTRFLNYEKVKKNCFFRFRSTVRSWFKANRSELVAVYLFMETNFILFDTYYVAC